MTTENVRDSLVDHVAVRHVVDRYTDALNGGDWDVLEDTFTEDAVWVVNTPTGEVPEPHVGRAEIVRSIRELVDGPRGGDVVQLNHATTVHVTGDAATARSTMESWVWAPGGTRTHVLAMYDDKLVREQDGEWRFARREWHTKAMFQEAPA